MAQLAKMNANTADPADALLKLEGPIVRDISASMESLMADVMEMVKYDILQYMDTARVMTYVGPDGVTPETFDLDPKSIIPSHLPGEDTGSTSKFSRMERLKNIARSIKTQIVPGGIHGIAKSKAKLLLLQASRGGLPISPIYVMKNALGIQDAEAVADEFFEYKEKELEMAARLKNEGASLTPQQGGATPAGSQKNTGGRPSSGRKPPTAKTKGSAEGPRATITTS